MPEQELRRKKKISTFNNCGGKTNPYEIENKIAYSCTDIGLGHDRCVV
jgi:hypothetical protein